MGSFYPQRLPQVQPHTRRWRVDQDLRFRNPDLQTGNGDAIARILHPRQLTFDTTLRVNLSQMLRLLGEETDMYIPIKKVDDFIHDDKNGNQQRN